MKAVMFNGSVNKPLILEIIKLWILDSLNTDKNRKLSTKHRKRRVSFWVSKYPQAEQLLLQWMLPAEKEFPGP